MLVFILTFGFNINTLNSNRVLCKLYFYALYLFSRLVPSILILASIDRLLLSSQNVDTRLYSSKRLAYFSISISTLFWVIFYIHTLVKVDIFQSYPGIFMCYYDTMGFYFAFVNYSSLLLNIISSVALVILSILAYKNVRRIRIVPRQQRHQFRSMNKKDFQLLRSLYVHDIVYTIFFIIPSILGTYLAATQYQTRTPLPATIETLLNQFNGFIHSIPFCVSFFIFISVSKAFRQEIKRFICKMFGKNPIPIREEENNRRQNEGENNIELNVVSAIVLPA